MDGALQRLRFDWVYRPGLTPEAANRFNVLPDDALYQAFQSVVTGRAPDAGGFDVSPVRDDRPYFFHFFQWSQTSAVLAQLGATWQPFGGAGFLILVPLGGAAMLAALVLIVAPLAGGRRFHLPGGEGQVEGAGGPGGSETRPYPAQSGSVARLPLRLTYFAGAGAGYTFVQLALLQRLILLLDLPTIAFAVGLGALLVWSGLGGLRWGRAATRPAVGAAAAAVATMAVLGMSAFGTAPLVGAPAWARGLVGVIALLPAGLAMGAVLPAGLAALAGAPRGVTAWAWAINGVASVSAAVAATIVLVTFGFAATMAGGAFWYGLAAVCWLPTRRREALRPAL
ncbi:MAG: hypothetical protein FJ029_15545 [Actinobacteria bacterium]|nr:hypothetical protein [Actinomycetota bacterium]